MHDKVYFFLLTYSRGDSRLFAFPAYSKQMAWLAAAGYAACHTLNPAVTSIAFQYEKRIVAVATEDGECSQLQALDYLHNPSVG